MIETIIRPAKLNDFAYIDSLRKREGNALGFIPKDCYLSIMSHLPVDGRYRHRYSDLMVTVDNDDLTGFCYSTYSDAIARIVQIVVQEDARRWHRALLLENYVRRKALEVGKSSINCRVAYDLESNDFWKALGYIPTKIVTSTWLNQKESKVKRPLVVYNLPLELLLFSSKF